MRWRWPRTPRRTGAVIHLALSACRLPPSHVEVARLAWLCLHPKGVDRAES
jgi:hypothetical protein